MAMMQRFETGSVVGCCTVFGMSVSAGEGHVDEVVGFVGGGFIVTNVVTEGCMEETRDQVKINPMSKKNCSMMRRVIIRTMSDKRKVFKNNLAFFHAKSMELVG